ncbi:MAG TPA: DJ-1/PfpI family protein [Ideonella sp.]|nr:DJ-1/PfpI family protein [Ideonella sp.]
MRVAIVTFDGFDELDAFVAFGLLNRLAAHGWKAEIAAPAAQVTSAGGVTVQAQRPLEFANEADAVLFGGGLYTRAVAESSALPDRLQLDPLRQSIGAQCAGALLLARLGLLADMPACADAATRPWLVESGVRVVDEPFYARGPVATAGGCLASIYLASWLMLRGAGPEAARQVLRQAAPAGDKDAWVERTLGVVAPFVPEAG